MSLVRITRRLSREVNKLSFAEPVAYVYNPLAYAREPHEKYLELYGQGPKRVLLMGMNPGPFGMAQTGVPFGDVALVRDWLGVSGQVKRPKKEHPKRPILGFDCERSEVSGTRFWGWVRDRFETPERFFERFFVHNYCPLVFMEESSRNRTPDRLTKEERAQLFAICDEALRSMVRALEPEWVIGVGGFAQKRAQVALDGNDKVKVGVMLHPSPASPKANQGWVPVVEKELEELGIEL